MADHAAPVEVVLTRDERDVLRAGLVEWGGPAAPTEALARTMTGARVHDDKY